VLAPLHVGWTPSTRKLSVALATATTSTASKQWPLRHSRPSGCKHGDGTENRTARLSRTAGGRCAHLPPGACHGDGGVVGDVLVVVLLKVPVFV
jgi:hypothetical protein